jgi:hypothetical protein
MTAYFLRVLAVLMVFATPLHAQDAHVPEGYESFEAYEIAMFERIGELAEQGNLNISGLLAKRDELRAEYAAARQNGDRSGMLEAEALRATLIRAALEEINRRVNN